MTTKAAGLSRGILILTADPSFLGPLQAELASRGFAVYAEKDLDALAGTLKARLPQLLVLDLDVSEEPAWDVLSSLRQDPHTRRMPVVAATARFRAPREVISGLRAGAVEYVMKPCDMRVLAARIEAVIKAMERRRKAAAEEPVLKTKDGLLKMDLRAHSCLLNSGSEQREIPLTPHEFSLLSHLMSRRNNLVAKEELLRVLWPADWSADGNLATLAQFIAHLRKKLGPVKARLKTVWGLGYRLED